VPFWAVPFWAVPFWVRPARLPAAVFPAAVFPAVFPGVPTWRMPSFATGWSAAGRNGRTDGAVDSSGSAGASAANSRLRASAAVG
jgi:hypothetical protein